MLQMVDYAESVSFRFVPFCEPLYCIVLLVHQVSHIATMRAGSTNSNEILLVIPGDVLWKKWPELQHTLSQFAVTVNISLPVHLPLPAVNGYTNT
jgi:hypothetical protein